MRKPCCDKESINKGAWSKQEDQKLIDYIQAHGEGCWRAIPKAAGLHRCGKSCRLRWLNYLRPDIKRGVFAQDEEDLIIKLHALLGNRWSLIAGRLPGRTDNEVKNYWNSHIRRKLIKLGIDPNNHKKHHTFPPYHHNNIVSNNSTANTSSLSMNKDQTSTAAMEEDNGIISIITKNSCSNIIEEEETAATVSPSSPLNLDLTIALPSNNSLSFDNKTGNMDIDLNC